MTKIEPGDQIVFDWELEYVASQGIEATHLDVKRLQRGAMTLEGLEDSAWEERVNKDGLVALEDCNVINVRYSIIRDGETIYEGMWEDGLCHREELAK